MNRYGEAMAYESDPIARKLDHLVSSRELYFDLDSFEALNQAEQALIGAWELANEVYNGGFTQYFHNSSGARAKPMIGVLRSIDADGAASVLESAIELAGPGTSWGKQPNYLAAINSMPADVKERLHELERKLYVELDDLHLKVLRFLSQHRDQIDAPADFWIDKATP
jgi:hypothetical protein